MKNKWCFIDDSLIIISKTIVIVSFLPLVICCSPQAQDKPTQTKIISEDSTPTSNNQQLSDCKKLLADAKKIDSTLLKAIEIKPDIANKAIKAFTDFAYFCQQDSLSPIYLIKTAQVAQAINSSAQAKIVLDKCITDYPTSKHRAAALFLLAQLYDETIYLNNESEAKKLYEKILQEYPKSDWAKSAKGALNFIGKTDEQIMEELKKK